MTYTDKLQLGQNYNFKLNILPGQVKSISSCRGGQNYNKILSGFQTRDVSPVEEVRQIIKKNKNKKIGYNFAEEIH